MKPVLLLLSIVTSLLIISCQKEISVELPERIQTTNTDDSVFLTKIYMIDSTAAGEDTTDRWTWYYDNQKRMIKFSDTLSVSAGGNNDESEIYQYSYSGSDTLPFKTVLIRGINLTDTTIIWHSFFPNGRKSKDSVWKNDYLSSTRPAYTSVTSYSYGPSKVYGKTFSDIYGLYELHAFDTATLDANGNVIAATRYLKHFTTGAFVLSVTSTIQYDNHPSPFSRLSNYKAYLIFPDYEILPHVSYDFVQNNNILLTEQISYYPFSSTYDSEDFANTFTYRASGLPDRIRYTDPTVPGEVVKFIYKYRKF